MQASPLCLRDQLAQDYRSPPHPPPAGIFQPGFPEPGVSPPPRPPQSFMHSHSFPEISPHLPKKVMNDPVISVCTDFEGETFHRSDISKEVTYFENTMSQDFKGFPSIFKHDSSRI